MGKLFVVGIGPGGPGGMTIAARRALFDRACDIAAKQDDKSIVRPG